MAKQIGTATSPVTLTSDPAHNMRLGTAYLREMLDSSTTHCRSQSPRTTPGRIASISG